MGSGVCFQESVQVLLRKRQEFVKCEALMDLEKVYNWVDKNSLWKVLQIYGVWDES